MIGKQFNSGSENKIFEELNYIFVSLKFILFLICMFLVLLIKNLYS